MAASIIREIKDTVSGVQKHLPFQVKYHKDDWSNTAEYFHHVERTVHPVVTELVKWATQTVPPTSSSTFLDEGCGPGIVTLEIKKAFPENSVLGVDHSAGMLKAFDSRAKKLNWKNVKTKLADAEEKSDVPTDSITHAFACTYIDLSHKDTVLLQELVRVIAPGGILALSTWTDPTHPSISTPWINACQKFHPEVKPPHISNPEWATPESIKQKLEKAGFKDVQTKQVWTHWRFKDPDDMSEWFLNGGNPVCKLWHEALTDVYKGDKSDVREEFHKELEREYRNEGGQIVKEELVNLTIARL